jgi:hypothetical protein
MIDPLLVAWNYLLFPLFHRRVHHVHHHRHEA